MDFWVFLQAYRRALEGAGRNYISLKLVFSLSPRSSHSRLSSPDSHVVFRITWKPLCAFLHDHLFLYSPSLRHATPQLVKFTGFILCETLCGLQCWLASWEPLPLALIPDHKLLLYRTYVVFFAWVPVQIQISPLSHFPPPEGFTYSMDSNI